MTDEPGIVGFVRVGITGANGFIGNHVVRLVLERNHRPVALLQRGTNVRALSDLRGEYDEVLGKHPRSRVPGLVRGRV